MSDKEIKTNIFNTTLKSQNPETMDSRIESQQIRSKEIKDNPDILTVGMGKPAMPRPNAFQAMLSGLAGGLQQGRQLSPYASPLESMVSGAVGGYGGYQQAQQQAEVNQALEMENTPMELISPAIVEAIPAAKGMSFRQFKELKDFFGNQLKSQTQVGLETMKESGRMERATANRITLEQAKEYAPMLGVSPENLIGQDVNRIINAVARIKARQERVTWKDAPFEVNGTVFGTTQYSPETGSIRYVTKPGGGKAAQTLQSLTTLRNNLNDLFDEALGYDTGRFKGVFDYGKALVGSNPDIRAFDSIVKIQRSNIAKVVGSDVGNLAVQEQVVAENALPEVMTKWGQMADTQEELESKRRIINQLLDSKIEAITGTFGGSIYGGGGTKKEKPSGTEKPKESGGGIKPGGFKKFIGK